MMAKEELAKVQVRNQKYYCNGTAVVKFGHRNRKACRPPDAANIPSSPKLRQRFAVSNAMGRKLSYSFSWLFR